MSEEASEAKSTTPEATKEAKKDLPVGEVGEWRPSWFNFMKSVMVIILAPVIGFGIRWLWPESPDSQVVDAIIGAAIGFGCLSLPVYLGVSIVRKTSTLALYTDARVRYRTGVIARVSTEVMAKDIRSIDVTQTTMERILGIGKIDISTASRGDNEITMSKVRNPEKIRNEINRFRDDDPSNDTAD